MSDELSKVELKELRIVARTDRRAEDAWAYDDTFVEAFLKNVGPQYLAYSTAIRMYWRAKCSRRELARALGMTLDGVKSLITIIRKRAEAFSKRLAENKNGETIESPVLEKSAPAKFNLAHTIRSQDILSFADGDKDTVNFVEEYKKLSVESILALFNPSISPRLIALQNKCADLGAEKTQSEQITKLVEEAADLQLSVILPDAFEGLPAVRKIAEDPRTRDYEPGIRGRPRKVRLVTVKRKRGRPRKTEFVEPLAVENLENVPPEMAEKCFAPLTEGFSSKKEFAHV